jgi:uncharacterized membrane protein
MDSQDNQNQNQTGGETNQSQKQGTTPSMGKSNSTILAVLSYLGPLVIFSYLMAKDDEFIKFHARQGIVVFGLEVIVWLLGGMLYSFWMIINILNLITLILSIIGIVNVLQGNKKELPVVGGLAGSFGL